MIIRDEQPGDAATIRDLVRSAFAGTEHGSGTEDQIIDALREADVLAVSLVALEDLEVIGYVAISPVFISGAEGWYGLGPVAVRPQHQQRGFGSALIREALDRLRKSGASGCVVLGDPAFYGKFGFAHDPEITYAGAPPPYFQVLKFGAQGPRGTVEYHPAFDVSP